MVCVFVCARLQYWVSAVFLVKMSGSSIIAVIGSGEMALLSQHVDIYDSKLLKMSLWLVVQAETGLSRPDVVGCFTNYIILILRAVWFKKKNRNRWVD